MFVYMPVTTRDPEETCCHHCLLVLLGRKLIFSRSEFKITEAWNCNMECRRGASFLNRHSATGVEGCGPSRSSDTIGKEEEDPLLRLSEEQAPVTFHLRVLTLYSP